MGRRGMFGSVGVVAALFLAVAPDGLANNISGANGLTGCGVVNHGDPNPHTFFYSALTSVVASAQDDVRISIYDPTDVDTQVLGSPTSATDAVVHDENYTTTCGIAWDDPYFNTYGLSSCVGLDQANRCQRSDVRFDTSDINGSLGLAERWTLVCHETGHTLGLLHRTAPSCMIQNTIANPYAGLTQDHDVVHLLLNY